MSAGTLALTNNSDVVPGTGTAFSTELVSGDFVVVTVGGITYTLPVKSVESNSQITLISKYQGPSQSAVAWYAVPRATQNQVTAALVAQTTEALRGLNSDKRNWQAVFSDSGDITVILPDGSTFSGPSWKKIIELLNSIDPEAIQALANQIHADAEQVAADRLDVDAKASQVALDVTTASNAANSAISANTAAQDAKSNAAQSAQEAEQIRDEIGDLQSAVDAVNGVATLPLGLPFWWFSRANIPSGCVAYDGQELDQSTYPTVYAAIVAGTLPVVTEAIWQSTPSKRNCFTLGATSGKFRCPDMNGATAGSIAQIAMTGGTAAQEGIKKGEAPNIKGTLTASTGGAVSASGAFSQPSSPAATTISAGSAATIRTGDIIFDASKYNSGYSDAATDFHPARANGVICGQLFGRVSNPGDVDGATLATRMEAINTDLLGRITSQIEAGKWYDWNDPLVTAFITWASGLTNSSGNLRVKFSKYEIRIKGSMIKSFPSSPELFRLNSAPFASIARYCVPETVVTNGATNANVFTVPVDVTVPSGCIVTVVTGSSTSKYIVDILITLNY